MLPVLSPTKTKGRKQDTDTLLPPPPPPPSHECGEGMEWHSDGAEGEFTVLFSLDDVTDDQVCHPFLLYNHP